ncbi:MAG: hypothetical protein ACE5HQ_03085 [Gemmatimonadota bacterium]
MQRRVLGIAMVLSLGAHAAVLAYFHLTIHPVSDDESARPLRVIQLSKATLLERPLQVLKVRPVTRRSSSSSSASSSRARGGLRIARSKLSGHLTAKPVLRAASYPTTGEMNLAVVRTVAAQPLRLTRSRRGVVQRANVRFASTNGEVAFRAASQAARDRERRRRGILGGRGGSGIVITGLGGDCNTPTSLVDSFAGAFQGRGIGVGGH